MTTQTDVLVSEWRSISQSRTGLCERVTGRNVCMWVYMYGGMYMCERVCVCVCVCVCIRRQVGNYAFEARMYVCMYLYMHVSIYVRVRGVCVCVCVCVCARVCECSCVNR